MAKGGAQKHEAKAREQQSKRSPPPRKWWNLNWFWQETDPVARLTGYIAVLTFVLAIIGGVQAWAFIASERAFVYVATDFVNPSPTQPGKQISIGVSVHNEGRAEAIIVDANITILPLSDPLPSIPSYAHSRYEALPGQIGAGVAFNGVFLPKGPHGEPGTFGTDQVNDITAGRLRIYVFGWIEYKDAFSMFGTRKTRFCGVYDPGNPTDHAFNNCGLPSYVNAD